MSHGAVVFDGDDTLWLVEPLYDEARSEAARVVADAGLDELAWDGLERAIDLERVATLGVSAQRFPNSCVEAYEVLCRHLRCQPDRRIAEKIRQTASQVFDRQALLIDDAAEVVSEARRFGPVGLLTKGEDWVQHKRIADAGLANAFDDIQIVSTKGPAQFKSILRRLSASIRRSTSVGNSLPSDINPALQLGMAAIWIESYVWQHEHRESSPVDGNLLIAPSLSDVPLLLRSLDDMRGKHKRSRRHKASA